MIPTESKNSAEWLRAEFLSRRQKNPRFTIRAFAKYLKLPSGRVSELLSGKRKLTLELANRIAERMVYSSEQKLSFFETVVDDRNKNELKKFDNALLYHELSEDVFQVIADWQHFALLNLIKTVDFDADTKWIAKRLGIKTAEVRETIKRLERLGFLKKIEGKWQRNHENLVTTYEIPSLALRKAHRQYIEKAFDSLETVALDKRDVTYITFPANVKKIKKAKALIKDFERKIAALMDEGERTEVYQMNVQLFPLTKGRKNK